MLHLSSDRLAALADSEPAPLEADHLATCATCARERAASRALLMMAGAERGQLGMPLTRWDSLAPELHRAGLVTAGALMSVPTTAEPEPPAPSITVRRAVRWLQAAAVLLLVGGGAAIGRLSAGAPAISFDWSGEPAVGVSPTEGAPLPRLPSIPIALDSDAILPEFSSVDEAILALKRYEAAYQHAAAYLADNDSTARIDDSDAYRARLTALDRAGRAMSEALREAPYDPVINGYYLTTLSQREATLRDLDRALPTGHRIRSF
ncbi:MAG: hypothetical protein M3303_09490 [Gemmatimonadota bacterium]|nr:hypothetical protein [Gemmatimonadota bacterium]